MLISAPPALNPAMIHESTRVNSSEAATRSDNRLRRLTAFAQSRHVAVIYGRFGKSPFDRECVVGLGGLEVRRETGKE